jgi:chromosome segregation and condensation protein ScpB
MGDICDQTAAAELAGILRQGGYVALVDVLGEGTPLSVRQIAERLKISRNAAEKMISDARKLLAEKGGIELPIARPPARVKKKKPVKRAKLIQKAIHPLNVNKLTPKAPPPLDFSSIFCEALALRDIALDVFGKRIRLSFSAAIAAFITSILKDSRRSSDAPKKTTSSFAAASTMSKISHYKNNCKQTNAFSYFTKLVQTKVWEQLRVEGRLEMGLSPWGRSGRSA